ncbi:uncharacterized protein [Diabrotica undecimpunctata]|uniref:uncharacterized protein n=1 Tax=Diabrotica undecimpunctata TaxID=50387 RepID=UPI003B6376FA
MILDTKLTWKTHIQLKKSCMQNMNILKVLANHNWEADITQLLNIYKTQIRSELDYGSIVYSSAKDSLLKQLDIIQNTALRLALGAYRTSPVESLYVEVDEPPLSIRRHRLSLQYAAKIEANSNNPAYSYTFSDNFHLIFEQNPFLSALFFSKRITGFNFPKVISNEINYPSPWTIKLPKCNTNLLLYHKSDTSSHIILQRFQAIKDKYKRYYQIYTDASKTSEMETVGAAFVDETIKHQFQLPKEYSIYSAELYAISKALQRISNQPKLEPVIFTDSLSAVQGILRVYPNHPILCQIKIDLEELYSKNKRVEFVWIPSHVDIIGNEKADQEAKEACCMNRPDKELLKIPHSDIQDIIKEFSMRIWLERWKKHDDNKLQRINLNLSPKGIMPQKRRDQVIQHRLTIGHTRLTHQYLMKKE